MLEICINKFNVVGNGVIDDTENIQKAIKYCAEHGYSLVFESKQYICNTIFIPKNSNINFNGATIICKSFHFMHNFCPQDTFTKYNGHGNISIKNLRITGGHVASFIHGENILFENIYAYNTECDHYFEICSCKNVIIRNCVLLGMKEQAPDRRMVEMIQIDNCDKFAFPWFDNEYSVTYDENTNQNILIENCKFDKSDGEFNHMYTAIGIHRADKEFHKNITIKNCEFYNAEYTAIHGIRWDNIKLITNKFINCKNYIFEDCTNLYIDEQSV